MTRGGRRTHISACVRFAGAKSARILDSQRSARKGAHRGTPNGPATFLRRANERDMAPTVEFLRCQDRGHQMWGRLLTCGRLAIGLLTFVRIFLADTHIYFRDHRPHPPTATLSFCRPSYLPNMAPAWQPPAESKLSLANRFRTSIPGHGPFTRQHVHRTALPAHARGRQYGDGCHSLSGSTD